MFEPPTDDTPTDAWHLPIWLAQSIEVAPDDVHLNGANLDEVEVSILSTTPLEEILQPGIQDIRRILAKKRATLEIRSDLQTLIPAWNVCFDQLLWPPVEVLADLAIEGSEVSVGITFWPFNFGIHVWTNALMINKPQLERLVEIGRTLKRAGGALTSERHPRGIELIARVPYPQLFQEHSEDGRLKLLAAIRAIERISHGARFQISSVQIDGRFLLSAEVFKPLEAPAKPNVNGVTLTDRQQQCLRLLAEGKRPEQIAHEMGIGTSRANKLIAAVRRKLGAKTRDQALLEAMRLGLIKAHDT